jgi:hypothetical protein
MASKPRVLTTSQQEESTLQLVRGIAQDTSTLVRKELELARIEITEAVIARLKAVGALGGAGVCMLLAVLFGGAAGAAALATVMPTWAALLIVMGAFFVTAGMTAMIGVIRMKSPPMAPQETERTIKEDVEWAKEALKR